MAQHSEFWSVRIHSLVTTQYSGIYELVFLEEREARKCYSDLCAKLNMAKILQPNAVRYADSFGIESCIPLHIIACVTYGKISDLHKRTIDVQDTQEVVSRAYVRETGPSKPGFSTKKD